MSKYDDYWNSKGEYGKERVRRKQLRKKKRLDKRKKCPVCGRTTGGVVSLVMNPYHKEMYNCEIWERMCLQCYEDSMNDI